MLPARTSTSLSSTRSRLQRIRTSSHDVLEKLPAKTLAYARWQNPVVSFASLFAGFVLCTGHHIFYSVLDGRVVSQQPYIIRQWAVSIGTGFAFLADSAMSISIGITFWQLFWATLHKKSLKLSTIDSLADSFQSITKLLNYRVIKASPLLVLLALTAIVIIPIATIFPPGTLRTKAHYLEATFYNQLVEVPTWNQPDNFSTFSSKDGHYLGPTRNLVRSTCSATCQMDVPALPQIKGVPNATYEIDMYAPTLQCREASSDLLANFSALFNCTNGPYGTCGNKQNIYTYLSWAPLCNETQCAANTHTNVAFNGSLPSYIRNVGTPGYGPAQLYISTLNGGPATDWSNLDNWSVLNCSLYNASMVANFSFSNDHSQAYFDSARTKVLNSVALADGDRIANNSATEKSYLGIMDALGGILAGTVYWNHDFQEWLVRDTVILDSKLAKAAEVTPWSTLTDNQTLWNITAHNNTGEPSLGALIEDLFHNITLSLFAHGDFTEPITVPEVFSTWHTIRFEYGPAHLLIAYGSVLLLTSIITIIGYVSVVKEGKSYSNRLSTVIRTMQNDELNAVINERHRGGEEPLPRQLAMTRVQITRPRAISFAVPVTTHVLRRSSRAGSGSA